MKDHHLSHMSESLLREMIDFIKKKIKSKVAVKALGFWVSGEPQNGIFNLQNLKEEGKKFN